MDTLRRSARPWILLFSVACVLVCLPSPKVGAEELTESDYDLYSRAAPGSFRAAQELDQGADTSLDTGLAASSGPAPGSFRAAQDGNGWQMESGLLFIEGVTPRKSQYDQNFDDSYSGLRLSLPAGR